MKRDDLDDHESPVKIRGGSWQFRRRRGTVAAVVAVPCHQLLREVAALEAPACDRAPE